MTVENLVSSIVDERHLALRRMLAALTARVQRLARRHGAKHPELHEVARRFECLADRVRDHMAAEERTLFPYIRAVVEAASAGVRLPRSPVRSLDDAFRTLEEEHVEIGIAMAKIRTLTRGYEAPRDGDGSYRHCMHDLEAFDRELDAVLRLENDMLFSQARAAMPWLHERGQLRPLGHVLFGNLQA